MSEAVVGRAAGDAWTVRPERATDEAQVEAVVTAAFGGARVASLLQDMRRDHCWLGLSFVAEPRGRPGEVVGHVAYTRAWLDAPTGLVDVLNLSPLSVSPPWQRQGVGSRLVRRTLELLRARTEPLVFLEGDPAYYGRLGFRPAGEAGFLRPSVRIPEAGFQVHRLHPHAADVSGALVYPDVFWRHGAVGPSAGEGHE